VGLKFGVSDDTYLMLVCVQEVVWHGGGGAAGFHVRSPECHGL